MCGKNGSVYILYDITDDDKIYVKVTRTTLAYLRIIIAKIGARGG